MACIVATLAGSWSIGELLGIKHSLQNKVKEAPLFYASYIVILILAASLVASGINLINLSVAIEVMNALLLPIVLGFLYLLAIKALPEQHRLKGKYAILVAIVFFVTCFFGIYGGVSGMFS